MAPPKKNNPGKQNPAIPSRESTEEQPAYKIFTGDNIEVGISKLARNLKMGQSKDTEMGKSKGKDRSQGKAIFLVGAGCSASTGIPLAKEISKEMCLEAANRLKDHERLSFKDEEYAKAFEWLKDNDYLPTDLSLDLAYGEIFENLFKSTRQKEVIRKAIEKGGGKINWAHLCLGELVRLRSVHTVLTTNFDLLVLEGLVRAGILPVIADGLESMDRISSKPEFPQVVHLHGSIHTYRLRNSTSSVEETGGKMEYSAAVYSFLKDSDCLVIIGYAGGEEGIMNLFNKAAESLSKSQEMEIFWVQYHENPNELSPNAKKLLTASGKNGALIAGIDADKFFYKLMQSTGFGAPECLKKPISFLDQRAQKIKMPEDNKSISQEIKDYLDELKRLEECKKSDSDEDETDNILSLVNESITKGNLTEAQSLMEKVKEPDEKTEEKFMEIAVLLGNELFTKDKFDLSIKYYEKALASGLKTYGPEHPNVATVWNRLGMAWDNKGQYDKAIEYFEKALATSLKTYGPEHPNVAATWNNIGMTWTLNNEPEKAIEYLEKALASDLKTCGSEHPTVATTWNNIGMAWASKDEPEKAIEYLEKALASGLKTYGSDHPNLAATWNNLGSAWESKGEYDKAIEYYERALASGLKTYGPDHPNVATAWNNLGMVWDNKGQYDKAIEYFEKALASYLKTYGPKHPDVATTWNNLGMAWANKGEFEKAIEFSKKALEIVKRMGLPHRVAHVERNLKKIIEMKGKQE